MTDDKGATQRSAWLDDNDNPFVRRWLKLAQDEERERIKYRCPSCGCDGRFMGCWCADTGSTD